MRTRAHVGAPMCADAQIHMDRYGGKCGKQNTKLANSRDLVIIAPDSWTYHLTTNLPNPSFLLCRAIGDQVKHTSWSVDAKTIVFADISFCRCDPRTFTEPPC